MFLHDSQKLDNDLRARSDEDLTLSGLLGIVDGIKRIVENTSLDHFVEVEISFPFSFEILKSVSLE